MVIPLYRNGGLTLTPGIGVGWNSENQNEYYYGVSRHESARSGLRSYDPESSWNPYLELSANYNFLGNWSVYGTARYTRLSDEVTDSPMVDKSWTGLISTGVTYSSDTTVCQTLARRDAGFFVHIRDEY